MHNEQAGTCQRDTSSTLEGEGRTTQSRDKPQAREGQTRRRNADDHLRQDPCKNSHTHTQINIGDKTHTICKVHYSSWLVRCCPIVWRQNLAKRTLYPTCVMYASWSTLLRNTGTQRGEDMSLDPRCGGEKASHAARACC